MNVILYAVQYLICWPWGRAPKQGSQNRSSCKMSAYFWLRFAFCQVWLMQ